MFFFKYGYISSIQASQERKLENKKSIAENDIQQ